MKKSVAFVACSAFLLGGCLEAGTEAVTSETGATSETVSAEISGSIEVSGSASVSTTAPSLRAMVQSIYGLGPCNTSNEGDATYVIDEEAYFQCTGGLWSEQKQATSVGNTCTISGNGNNNVVFCGNATIGTLVIGGNSALDTSVAAIVGKDGKDGVDGKDGRDGIDGKDGVDGQDGTSCTVAILADNSGYKILCGGDSVGVLLHGLNGVDGKDGRDGVDGKDGIDGKDGRDGVDGKDGIDGKDGRDGVDGKDGIDGKDGRDGVDGKDGIDGKDGRDGVDGKDGIDGKDGRDGVDGKDGRDGVDGKDGIDGKDGRDGVDGKDGIDGKDGRDGVDGKDGKDCNCCDTVEITKKTWANLNPDIDYCQFQDTRDGQWYKCVVIGNQTWMAENLNYAGTASKSWCYKNQEANCDIYGRLYSWAAAADVSESYNRSSARISKKHQGACPIGWHLPTNPEWDSLAYVVSKKNSYIGKALLAKTYGGTDDLGFSAMLAGNWKTDLIDRSDYFDNVDWVADFWSATESSDSAIRRNIGYYDNTSLNTEYEEKYEWGYSVRCVKD